MWDESVVRYGQCRHHKQEIGLSNPLTKRNSIEHSKDTVLHEIAHALTGEGHGHNAVWKRTCVKVGARPERCYNGDVKTFVGKYKLINKDTGQVYRHYHRKPNVSDWPQRWMLGKKAETFGKLQLIVSAETEAGTELLLKELDDFSRSRRAKNKKYKLLNKDTGQVYRHYQRKPNVSDWPQRWIPGKKEETYGKLQLQLIVSAETEAAPSNGKKRKRAHRAHVTESEEKEDVQTLSSTLTENYSLDGFNRF